MHQMIIFSLYNVIYLYDSLLNVFIFTQKQSIIDSKYLYYQCSLNFFPVYEPSETAHNPFLQQTHHMVSDTMQFYVYMISSIKLLSRQFRTIARYLFLFLHSSLVH